MSLSYRERSERSLSRRKFLTASNQALLGAAVPVGSTVSTKHAEPIIDIHQHVGYSGRPDDMLLAHQLEMGITTTVLLPAGRAVQMASTHDGKSNGLAAQAL